jgi:hypothetical protein
LSNDITKFEQTSTNIVAAPIPKPLIAEVVVANVGHIPKSSTSTGFSLSIPFDNIFKLLLIIFSS